MQKSFAILLFMLVCAQSRAQFFQPVFPNLTGQALLDSVVTHFKPQTVLEYSPARDTMYSKIYLEGDTVYCVYSRHGLALTPNADPTNDLFMNGVANGINCEHTFPQSFGAENGNAKSDMHHLFPARVAVNDARANQPFGDVPDNQTQKWFFKNQSMGSIPTASINEYSEEGPVFFEVREAQKGNTARAMLYFYTMYQAEADAADPSYFESQRATLCTWQDLDPVDSLEWLRTWKIANYQDGKPNPFVLDCTLAARTWCENFSTPNCNKVGTENQTRFDDFLAYPNPTSGRVNLKMTLSASISVDITILDCMGKQVGALAKKVFPAGRFDLELPYDLAPGLYFARLRGTGLEKSVKFVVH